MKKNIIKWGLRGLLAVLVIIQFFQIDRTNPPIESEKTLAVVDPPPAEVMTLLKPACYDCHSHETVYPWYTYIQPIGWWTKDHVEHGTKHLNFSVWGDYKEKRRLHKYEEIAEMVADKEMPMGVYLPAHKDARLTDAQRKLIVDWAKSKMVMEAPVPEAPAGEEEEADDEDGAA